MKKLFNYALIGAIALTGATMFTGCSGSDDAVAENNNPNFNEKTNDVNVQFVLNVATNTGDNTTRQSATIVQKNANFRGMKDAKLIGLASGKASSFLAPYAGETTQTGWTTGSNMKSKVYDLGTLYAANSVDNTGTNNENTSSHRVVELTLPLTTDAMLVYGRAIPSGTDEANGKVTMPTSYAAPENITFDLVSRLGDNGTKYSHTCNLVALILNRIMLSEVAALAYDSDSPYKTPRTATNANAYKQTEDLAALSWRTLGVDESGTLPPLQENLSKLYKAITGFTTSTTAIRSGSANAITDMVKDAYSIVKSVYEATPTTDDELNAQRLAYEILSRIEYYFTSSGGAFRTVGTPTTEGSIAKALVDNNVMLSSEFTTNYGDVTNVLLTGLPVSFNLPAGVSQLFFTAYSAETVATSGGFSYNSPSQSLIDIASTLNPAKYMYPSELLYFDNSLLRVNDAEVAAADYPNGYGTWDTESEWSGWTIGAVKSTTRSVAVKNNINYGVSMLQTSVALKSGVTEFKDNRSAIVTSESDQTLSVAEVSGFTLTGVLIGGQYKKLGWNYLAKAGASDNDNFVIYDNQIVNDGDIPTTSGNENYTLVFDNYSGGGDQQDVQVALEFQNGNEKDFYGKGGVIPKGSKFYLVGKLALTNGTGTISWPEKYAIPPYTAAGASTETKRVFIQDYTTTVTFTIGAESLKNAYSTVPDLRASQISLGLSVDLNWRPGLNFSVDL